MPLTTDTNLKIHAAMKNFLLCALLHILFCPSATAQTEVTFGYDAAGNRISRTIVLRATQSKAMPAAAKAGSRDDKVGGHDVKIYPDPAAGTVRVVVGNIDGKAGHIEVYGTGGMLVAKTDIVPTGNDIDLSRNQKGVYILRITVDGKASTWKIIKE